MVRCLCLFAGTAQQGLAKADYIILDIFIRMFITLYYRDILRQVLIFGK